MRITALSAAAVGFGAVLLATAAAAIDQHSVEAVRNALQSPIPESAIEQARQLDDQLLRTGAAMGTKAYLVTDERQQHVQSLVFRLLASIGENPQGWVVRVLDTDPKVVNAFVYGGKYIYVFTGLLEQVKSDNELAVVVGHEIGHSVLKHNIRSNQDLTVTLANLAAIYGQIKGGTGGANAMAMSKTLHNGYSRDDEREADAFGVLAAWHAGFDPLGGAGFFSRLERADDMASAAEQKALDDYKSKTVLVKSQCETERQQWANGQIAHTQHNADLINQTCAMYTQAANSYNATMAQRTANTLQANTGDHPGDLERVAAIAAMTDWLHGARSMTSLQEYPRAYGLIVALVQIKSPIFAGHGQVADNGNATRPSAQQGQGHTEFRTQLNALDDALDSGVITKPEYDSKFAALMARHRAQQGEN